MRWGLNCLFAAAPSRETLTAEFELYFSGEYSRMLERAREQ